MHLIDKCDVPKLFSKLLEGGLEHYLPPLPTGLIGVHDKLIFLQQLMYISFGTTKGFDLPILSTMLVFLVLYQQFFQKLSGDLSIQLPKKMGSPAVHHLNCPSVHESTTHVFERFLDNVPFDAVFFSDVIECMLL